MQSENRIYHFKNLGQPLGRIWAVPAIHGDLERLMQLHDALYEHFQVGDRIVYHGNYMGYSEQSAACIDEILAFRRLALATPGARPSDFIYLRGSQEELWQNLFSLHFAPDPVSILLWLLGNGLSSSLKSYGFCPHDGIEACRLGILAVTKWTGSIREKIRSMPGHEIFFGQLARAAYTEEQSAYPLLFIHAGLDENKPLEEQGDAFWWGAEKFESMEKAYLPFQKVVRGYDPAHKGARYNCIKATIDDGCGFGGALMCAGFEADGNISEILQV